MFDKKLQEQLIEISSQTAQQEYLQADNNPQECISMASHIVMDVPASSAFPKN